MATNYPGSLDNFTNPTSASPINSPSHADQHSNANDAIEAIEGELGTNPKGAKATVKVRLDDVDTEIALKAPIASPTFTGTVTIPAGSAISDVAYLNAANTFTATPQRIHNTNVSNQVLLVRAAPFQVAVLQEWQNSAGTAMAFVGSSGAFGTSSTVRGSGGGIFGGVTQLSSAALTVYPTSATAVGAIIRGVASQSFDLQQWQDSAGNLLAWVNFGGGIRGVSFRTTTMNTVSAPLAILATSTTAPAAVIRALTSQTANIQEWQDSSGTVLSNINNVGAANFVRAGIGGLTPGTTSLFVTSPNASYIATIIRAASGQTANITEWQDSSGGLLTAINNSGQIATFGRLTVGSSVVSTDARMVLLNTGTTTSVLQIIRGIASQTGDLTQWQNSAGTVLAKVTAAGDINIDISQGGTFHAQASGGQVGDYNLIKMSQVSTQKTTLLTTVVSGGNTEFSVKTLIGTLTTTLKIDKDSLVGIGKNNTSPLAQIDVRPQSASTVGAIIRAAASQTANLQEWQGSGGNALSIIDAYGALYLQDTAMIAPIGNWETDRFAPGGLTIINRGTASHIPLGIRGKVSQTADLTQWQDSAGTVLINVSSAGNFSANSSLTQAVRFRYLDNPAIDGAYIDTRLVAGTLGVVARSTTAATLAVRGVASQTADLQQWQNSAGTVLAKVDASGNATLANVTLGLLVSGSDYRGSYGIGGGGLTTSHGAFAMQSWSTTIVTGVLRAAASQTADLQQWQNSAGTTLVKVQSDGTVGVNGTPGTNTKFYIEESYTGNGGANTGLRVRGTGSSADNWKGRIIAGGDTVAFLMGEYGSQAWLGGHNAALNAWAAFYINPDGGANLYLGNTGVGGSTPIVTIQNSNGSVGIGTSSATAKLHIVNTSASAQGLIIKGAASQSANLQEWQNSAGTVLASVQANGYIQGSYINVTSGGGIISASSNQLYANNGSWLIVVPGPTKNGLIIQGAASQTANLQEWQNSTGTVLNAINSGGYFTGGQFDINGNLTNTLYIGAIRNLSAGNSYGSSETDETKLSLYGRTGQTSNFIEIKSIGGGSGKLLLSITPDGSIKGGNSFTISANTATTVDTVALSSFTTIEYTISIKQGSKVRSSKVLVHTDGTSVDFTEYGIIEMGGGITGILVTASVSSTNSILQVTITDAATTNATVKLIKTML